MDSMERYEMVEKLREKANVTYEEAKNALERCDWVLLDAVIFLEQEGRVEQNTYEAGYSKADEPKAEEHKKKEQKKTGGEFAAGVNKIFRDLKNLIAKGNRRSLEISYKDKPVIRLSLTLTIIILLILAPGVPFFLMVAFIAYFCGVRYSISTEGTEETAKPSAEDNDF